MSQPAKYHEALSIRGTHSGEQNEQSGHPVHSGDTIPDPVAQTVVQIANLHSEHHRQTTVAQRAIDKVTALCGRPGFVGGLATTIILWIGWNLSSGRLGYRPFDESTIPWLQTVSGIVALCLSALILATQRRENELANHRDQLTLELAVLSDQKASKIIELLEELRRDSPNVIDRVDRLADVLSKPVDTKAISDATKQEHADVANRVPTDEDQGPGEASA